MMISQPAFLCLQASWRRLIQGTRGDEEATTAPDMPALVNDVAQTHRNSRVMQSDGEAVRDSSGVRDFRTRSFVPQDDTTTGQRTSAEPGMVVSGSTMSQATDSVQSRAADVAPSGPLTAAERRARAAALRGLAFSRVRRFDAAQAAFTDAARLDPRLDLTRTPAFWKLERAAHEAAIDAYVAAGRDRDAAVLRARIRSTFRPRALRPRPGAVLST